MGISHDGQKAQDLFRTLTGASAADSAAKGDAKFEGTHVEVKKATTATLNQVRAVKYIPLAVFEQTTRTWFMVPAHIVVALVARKKRGQHTENPFESATLSMNSIQEYRVVGDLADATRAAIRAANGYPTLKAAMDRVLAESRALAQHSIDDVSRIVSELGIRTAADD